MPTDAPPLRNTLYMITRRNFLRSTATSSCLGLATGLYTWRWETHWVEVVERPLPLANLPDRLRGTRMIQLSDIHIGPRVDDSYLCRVFDEVSALDPDIVAYTGDFTSYEADELRHAARMFPRLPKGRRATVGILGNHDYGPAWSRPDHSDQIAALASASGVRILRNEILNVDGLQVIGLDDLWARRFHPEKVWPSLKPGSATLALSHNPDTVDEPVWAGYRGWILCGHTHGGQCKPPFLPPPILPVRNRNYVAGEYALAGGRRMYINRGLGHLMQVRFNVRPEITVFHLEPA